VSKESDDLAWFPAGVLPPAAVDDRSRLVRRARAAQSSERSSPAVADTPSR
jgi:hypothetical protein